MSYILDLVSKSVLDTPDSVKRCLIDSLSVLSEVLEQWMGGQGHRHRVRGVARHDASPQRVVTHQHDLGHRGVCNGAPSSHRDLMTFPCKRNVVRFSVVRNMSTGDRTQTPAKKEDQMAPQADLNAEMLIFRPSRIEFTQVSPAAGPRPRRDRSPRGSPRRRRGRQTALGRARRSAGTCRRRSARRRSPPPPPSARRGPPPTCAGTCL